MKPRLWLVRIEHTYCIVGPCGIEALLWTLEQWGYSGDNRDGSWGYQPA